MSDKCVELEARITTVEHVLFGPAGHEDEVGGILAEMRGLRQDLKAVEQKFSDSVESFTRWIAAFVATAAVAILVFVLNSIQLG